MSRILAIAVKELRQLARDRLTIAMGIMIPVIQLLLFGWAINTDVRHMPTVVLDYDHSPHGRALVQRMEASGTYDVVGRVASFEEVERALRRERARVGLVLPADFAARARLGRTAVAALVVDGSDPLTVGSATQAAQGLVAERGNEITEAAPPPPPAVRLEPMILYNPEQRTAVYIVPGLVGVILTMTMVMFTAMAIARERERGTLEALIVSPVRRWEIVVGKIVPYIAIGYLQMSLVLALGHLVFDVPIRGSIGLLYATSVLFIAANLAVGLLFSTLARTQQQAMQMSFFFLLPNILLSGFMFPFEGMPKLAQWIATALPLTHFLRIVRRIVLKGGAWPDVAAEATALGAILVVLVAAASLRFKKKLL
ncbi:MAG: ABC transporter permease [Deltaproteobacteria bacterium]|nr:MAG: ABC transporter permease [Deltaproteobacteria bacterium]